MLLNIGCGSMRHPAWTNLDSNPVSRDVLQWDVSKSLPFSNETVDACYASHVLEHLGRSEARGLLRECLRVLVRGGIIRLAVPDLEAIAREYVTQLEKADSGDRQSTHNHEWMILEMVDQLVRSSPGGEVRRYLTSGDVPNAEFVLSRVGSEASQLMQQGQVRTVESGRKARTIQLLQKVNPMRSRATRLPHAFSRLWKRLREKSATHLCGLLLGTNGHRAIAEGLFRQSGEVHRWMYDRVSLKRLLEECGFTHVRVCTAYESRIEGFASYGLDIVDGRVRKPDSLFMEAIKP